MEVQALIVTTPSVYLLWIVAMGGEGTSNRSYESRLQIQSRIVLTASSSFQCEEGIYKGRALNLDSPNRAQTLTAKNTSFCLIFVLS